MLRSYFKTTWRNLFRNKTFSLLNVMGLALGMACSLLILLWVQDERHVDTFHKNDAQLYAIFERQYHDGLIEAGYNTPGLLPEELKTQFPEVKYATGMAWGELNTFEANNKILKEEGDFGSPDFFLVFSYPLLHGRAETALLTPQDIAVSQKMAEDFFGSADAAIGQSIRFQNRKDLKITAVFENVKSNSSQKFDYILNWETFMENNSWARDWGNNGPDTYIVLREGTDAKAFENKIQDLLSRYNDNKNFIIKLCLQRYSAIYLHSNFKNGEVAGGRIQYVTLFSVIAIFILAIACINFMNLTTARSVKRAKEIGVRKVIGAVRSTLIRQFIGEAMLIVVLAFIFSLLMVALVLPWFNMITQKTITLPFDQPSFWIAACVLTLVTGFISGSYPALYLSSFNPVRAFKGSLKFSSSALWFRKGLVVFQFALSMMLIVGTIVISKQVNYIQSMHLGYDRENLIYIPLEGELLKKYELFKTQAITQPGVQTVSRISQSPTTLQNGTGGLDWEGKDPNSMTQFTQAAIGFDFTKTMNIPMAEGRDFSPDFASDSTGYIINEKASKIINYKDPIGKPLTFWQKKGTIIGVIKDFHFTSLHIAIRPLILRLNENWPWGWALIRIAPGKTTEVVASLEKICKDLNPQFPFTYQFSDEEYRKLYMSEQIVETLSNVFAFLAIFISCLGLLGLAMFTAEQRTKEVGIRKVLGASIVSLYALLSGELLILVSIAMVIAAPLAWYVMNNWLTAYAYRIEIAWWIFLAAGTLALFIALVTVSFQTLRASLVNPVNSLRAE